MRALVFEKSITYDPRHSEPEVTDGDTLLRIRQAGICATDLEITRGYMGFHGILGHEFVADVVSGPDRDLVGQRVVGEINIVCGRCDLCLSGLSTHCRNRSVLGILNHEGAFAEYVRLPRANLHIVPKNVDDDAAVFVEPLAAAYQVLKQVQLDARKWVTVLGDGRLGLLVAQVVRETGCQIRVIGKHPQKLGLCEKWSIKSRALSDIVPRHDQDVVIDCTGSAAGFEMALQMVAVGKPVNLAPAVIDEIQIIGSRCGPFREAMTALAEKRIDVTSLIHRRMKIEQGVEAMALAGKPGVLKVIITM
jgi:threonine dehydrogenase-like Zn-dependent dehydrogenase